MAGALRTRFSYLPTRNGNRLAARFLTASSSGWPQRQKSVYASVADLSAVAISFDFCRFLTDMVRCWRLLTPALILRPVVQPRDVIAELAKDGITVSSAQVSMTLCSAGYRRKRRGRKVAAVTAAAVSSSNGLNLDALIAAKALIAKLGSVEVAEEVLRAMKKLG